MPATPFDSAIYRDEEAGRLFDDAAEIRAMPAVEGEYPLGAGTTM